VDDSPETGLKQPDSCKSPTRRVPADPQLRCNHGYAADQPQVLVITMVLSFAIDDHIEGGVIAAVILLNIVVG
jgi:hypothetical protein